MPFVRTLIHKPIQTKATLRGNRKDINQPVSKKSIPVQSPDPSLFSSEDEDGVVSKEVFDKFCEKVWQEFNDVCGLVSSRFDRMMNAINENKKQAKATNLISHQRMKMLRVHHSIKRLQSLFTSLIRILKAHWLPKRWQDIKAII
ncbi:uncharacterized protein LOC124885124 isoform X2 [Capsicum annuum]|uniref:uncharacterized protein LOC124885124 isoform X2 n=1 Tax=Capsicum annuum TaxID=4072 RepID=UPI001FB135E3|nr:uncharacterized protein LOC124885124 isoform X2 [Capsicum annuum]